MKLTAFLPRLVLRWCYASSAEGRTVFGAVSGPEFVPGAPYVVGRLVVRFQVGRVFAQSWTKFVV